VKKFNVNKIKKILVFVSVCVAITILWPFNSILSTSNDIQAHRFCAYGEVYVEFERNGSTWGTTFLGSNGKPVSCSDDDTVPEQTVNKVNI